MADKKISELIAASAFTGVEKFEILQGGLNLAGTPEQMKTFVGAGPTREFDRAFSSELLFDKNQIEGVLHTQTAAITFTVAESENLADQWSVYGQRIVLDGVNPVYFEGFNHVANIASGDILEAGTYQFIFWYGNGIARASIMLPRQETVLLTPLATPTNFAADVGYDPDTEIYLSWTAVPNVSSYEIDVSTAGGGGPWTSVTAPAAGVTAYIHTGRTPNTTYHYRIRAIGNLISFSNSNYAITATTTEDAGDVTLPTMTHSIADTATGVAVNKVLILTFSEAIRKVGGAEITNANAGDVIAVKETNGAGAVIPCTFVIDSGKMEIQVTPNVIYGDTQLVFVEATGIEDTNANAMVTDNFTFTTSDYTEMEGNRLSLGNQVDSIIVGADKDFEIEWELKDVVLSGVKGIIQKYNTTDNQVSLLIRAVDDDVDFTIYLRETAVKLSKRTIAWPNALSAFTAGKLTWKYFGAIDTNNGLDRVDFYIDDVLITAGKNVTALGTWPWPFDISPGTAPFELTGVTFRETRNFQLRNNMGATTIVDIPIIRTGEDLSGNNFDGVWT